MDSNFGTSILTRFIPVGMCGHYCHEISTKSSMKNTCVIMQRVCIVMHITKVVLQFTSPILIMNQLILSSVVPGLWVLPGSTEGGLIEVAVSERPLAIFYHRRTDRQLQLRRSSVTAPCCASSRVRCHPPGPVCPVRVGNRLSHSSWPSLLAGPVATRPDLSE